MPRLTTLCHLERNDCYLMLHRVKKQIDINKGKWIGVGGKFEPGETPEECLMREVREETGFSLTGFKFRGFISFIYDNKEPEYIFVYSSTEFETSGRERRVAEYDAAGDSHAAANSGCELHDCAAANVNDAEDDCKMPAASPDDMPVPECDEGIFAWVPKRDILDLELWEGDRYMLKYLLYDRSETFSLKLCYDAEDNLTEAWEMAGHPIRLK